jgi:hypothetical protein
MRFGQDASGACQYPHKTQLWLEATHQTVHVSIFGHARDESLDPVHNLLVAFSGLAYRTPFPA